MTMTHAGLPLWWGVVIGCSALLLGLWAMASQVPTLSTVSARFSLTKIPLLGVVFSFLSRHTWPLLALKITFAVIFILIISAGLWGTPIVEKNLATTLTWNLWWTGIVIAVLFSGSAWCAICPWDNIASWLVNHTTWQRPDSNSRLQLKVPRLLRSVWPASLLFIGFTWLELGVGIVASPYSTALLALAMVILATTALALFEGKAFCRYMCPVGRTVGVYSQLSPIALRPIDNDICNSCTSLECFYGTEKIAPCPTKQVMGRLQENTYCTSCGNCTQSCPSQNVSWQLRSPSSEAIKDARPHVDEAFFMLILLALTQFHGLTMLDGWQRYLSAMAQTLSDTPQLIFSFTLGLLASLLLPILLYLIAISCTHKLCNKSTSNAKPNLKKLFSGFAFTVLPLAFAYHIAHNLTHFVRESSDWLALFSNPLGNGVEPLSMMEKHLRHTHSMVSTNTLFTLQGMVMLAGFIISVLVIRHRGYRLFTAKGLQLLPMLLFAGVITAFNVWMLIQPMTMRM